MATAFRFQHEWRVCADPDRVYAVLEDAEGYEIWWPQVRRVRPLDDDTGEVVVRSLLPFTLHLVLRRAVSDPAVRHLRVDIAGDLQGWASWRVAHDGDGAAAEFEQEVTLAHRRVARAARVVAPLLRWNHAWMMSSGRRGLAAYLGGADAGR